MSWFNVEEAGFFATVWAIAFLVAINRSVSVNPNQPWRVCVSSAALVGFYAFSVIGFFVGRSDAGVTGHWFYIAMASAIGLIGPYNQRMVIALAEKFGIPLQDERQNDHENQ